MVLSVRRINEFTEQMDNKKVKGAENKIEKIIDWALQNHAKTNADYRDQYDSIVSYDEEQDLKDELNWLSADQKQLVREDIVKKYSKAGWDISWNKIRLPYSSKQKYYLQIKGILTEE